MQRQPTLPLASDIPPTASERISDFGASALAVGLTLSGLCGSFLCRKSRWYSKERMWS